MSVWTKDNEDAYIDADVVFSFHPSGVFSAIQSYKMKIEDELMKE